MKKIFYFHARLSGGCNVDNGLSIDAAHGRRQFMEQISTITSSGLMDGCERFYIGLNGSNEDAEFVQRFMRPNCVLIHHDPRSESLLPTFRYLQKTLGEHPGAAIGFGHTKGITKPHDDLCRRWRACMMHHVVANWRMCVVDLQNGYNAVGCHWLSNSPNDPNADRWGGNSFFGGVFWWATQAYLATLPKLPEVITDRHTWFMPELWLGNGQPKVKDYHPGFPNCP